MGRADDLPRIEQLTFLRFIAAAGVIVFHFGQGAPSLAWGDPLWRYANTAVSFFFTLSGFILACVYERRGIRRAADFYVARLARIAPLYWLALAAVAALHLRKAQLDLGDLGLSLFLLQAWVPGHSQVINTPAWSLSVELFFYLCFPFLLRRMAGRRTRTLILLGGGAWLLCQAIYVGLSAGGRLDAAPRARDFVVYGPLLHCGAFIMGLAGGLLFLRHRERLRAYALPLMLGSLAIFLSVVLVPNPMVAFHHDGLFAPLFVAFLWGLGAAPDLAISRLFARPTLVLLGEASYGIYILQAVVKHIHDTAARRLALSPDVAFWSFFLLLIVAAVAGFRWLEVPARERLKAFYAERVARAVPGPAGPAPGPG
jgi:peptidoglycan/LPS O-acetylase OafA/YrhL